jgi:hypothetical protein
VIVISVGAIYAAMLVIYRGDRVNVTNFAFLAVAILLAAIVAVVYFRSRAVAQP